MGEALFKSLIESLQKNTCKIAHRVGYARIELSSAKPINGVCQQSRDLVGIAKRMIRRVGRQHRGRLAAMNPARVSSPLTVVCSRRIVKDTEAVCGLRVCAATPTIFLAKVTLDSHSNHYLGRGGTPFGVPDFLL